MSIKNTIPATRRAAHVSVVIGTLLCAAPVLAFDTPGGLYVEDDTLHWQTTAPSTNIYEDGSYLATVHGDTQYEPVRDGAVYQLVSHNFGIDFSPLSDPYLVPDDDGDEYDDEDVIEYDEAKIYFELNDTDGDLGLHALIDGESWRQLTIEDPNDRVIFSVDVTHSLLAQGMTEIFFESSEPTFDELNPIDFFQRFPAGEYDINGISIEGDELESEVQLSHVIPAAPANIMVSGASLPLSCEETDGPVVSSPYIVSWDPVMFSHATLGSAGLVDVEVYQVVVEREEPTPLKLSLNVSADVTSLELPSGLIGAGENIKMEVLTIAETGNQSAAETCFVSSD